MSSTMQTQHFVIIVCYFISNSLLFFRIFSVTLIQSLVVYIWRPKFSKTSCVLVQCSVTLHHLMERSNPRPQQNVWSPKLYHVKCRVAFLCCYLKPFSRVGPVWQRQEGRLHGESLGTGGVVRWWETLHRRRRRWVGGASPSGHHHPPPPLCGAGLPSSRKLGPFVDFKHKHLWTTFWVPSPVLGCVYSWYLISYHNDRGGYYNPYFI